MRLGNLREPLDNHHLKLYSRPGSGVRVQILVAAQLLRAPSHYYYRVSVPSCAALSQIMTNVTPIQLWFHLDSVQ